MKKYFLLILIYFYICLPANANEWIEIQNGFYINPKSIKEYYGTFGHNGKKTIWTKSYPVEEVKRRYPTANKVLVNYIIDCNKNKTATESLVIYDANEFVIYRFTFDEIYLQWLTVIPNTIQSFTFELACNGSTN